MFCILSVGVFNEGSALSPDFMVNIDPSTDWEAIESSISKPVESHFGIVLNVPVPPTLPDPEDIVTLPVPPGPVDDTNIPGPCIIDVTPAEDPPGNWETLICLVIFSFSESDIIIKSFPEAGVTFIGYVYIIAI